MDGQASPASTTIKWIRRVILGLAMIISFTLIVFAINESRNEVAMTLRGSDQMQIEMILRGDHELNLFPNPSTLRDGITKLSFPSCKGKNLDVKFTSDNFQGSMSAGFSGSWGNRVDVTVGGGSSQLKMRTSSLRSWYDSHRNWIPIRSLLD